MKPRHPTIEECFEAGKGPGYSSLHRYSASLLPDNEQERARFEAYMKGHCWDFGEYDEEAGGYDVLMVRMLYGVWRDRGALPTIFEEGK